MRPTSFFFNSDFFHTIFIRMGRGAVEVGVRVRLRAGVRVRVRVRVKVRNSV